MITFSKNVDPEIPKNFCYRATIFSNNVQHEIPKCEEKKVWSPTKIKIRRPQFRKLTISKFKNVKEIVWFLPSTKKYWKKRQLIFKNITFHLAWHIFVKNKQQGYLEKATSDGHKHFIFVTTFLWKLLFLKPFNLVGILFCFKSFSKQTNLCGRILLLKIVKKWV